jgi:methionyl-tRNA formyltransferase
MGTPAFAVPALKAVAAACELAAVVTQPDRPSGRGRKVSPSAVATTAEELNTRVMKPENVNVPEFRQTLSRMNVDLFAVVAFGAILSRDVLALPRLGSINLHGSLLPDYRGASPVQRALWDGRVGTGVTTLWMDEGIDTGDVILQRWVAIEPRDDAGALAARLADAGAPLLAESLTLAHAARAPRLAQDRGAGSYARKLSKQDGQVDWSLDVEAVWNRQRAVTPWPGASAWFRGNALQLLETRPLHRLTAAEPPGTVLDVTSEGIDLACGTGALRVFRLKAESRGEMNAAEWARGARVVRGDRMETNKEAHA